MCGYKHFNGRGVQPPYTTTLAQRNLLAKAASLQVKPGTFINYSTLEPSAEDMLDTAETPGLMNSIADGPKADDTASSMIPSNPAIEQMAEKRVEGPHDAAEARTKEISNEDRAKVFKYLKEFTKMTREYLEIEEPECRLRLTPEDITKVELGKTPAKKAKQDREAVSYTPHVKEKFEAFAKREANKGAHAEIKPFRCIFPSSTELLVGSTRFVTPLKNELLRASKDPNNPLNWWTVGLSPVEIGDRLLMYHMSIRAFKTAQLIIETDYSKMDATFTKLTDGHYRYFVKGMFHDDDHEFLDDILESHGKGRVSFRGPRFNKNVNGKKFNIKAKNFNKSGSGDTTMRNTFANAFTAYIGYRLAGMSIADAYAAIGPKYGDDGLDSGKCKIMEAARMLGFSIKMVAKTLDQKVEFLSRVYPCLNNDSICSYARIDRVCKLPTTCNHDISAGVYNKAVGYLVTDGSTPLIADYAHALLRVITADSQCGPMSEKRTSQVKNEMSYSALNYIETSMTSTDDRLQLTDEARFAANKDAIEYLGIAPPEYAKFLHDLKSVKSIAGLGQLRLIGEHAIEMPDMNGLLWKGGPGKLNPLSFSSRSRGTGERKPVPRGSGASAGARRGTPIGK
jgi:hypothetical protein